MRSIRDARKSLSGGSCIRCTEGGKVQLPGERVEGWQGVGSRAPIDVE